MRRREENAALAGLARVMTRYNEQEGLKRRAEELFEEETESFSRRHREEFSIDLFKTYNLYLERLEAEALTAAEKLEGIRPELEVEQGKVREARVRRRVIELLRERRKKEHDELVRKAERRDIEETNRNKLKITLETHDETRWKSRIPVEEVMDDDDGELQEKPGGESDLISDYFEKFGMEDPRKKR